MAVEVLVVIDEPELLRFRSWEGELGRAFGRLELETTWRAKQNAHKKTGKLAASITSKRKTYTNGNLGFEVGSWTVKYAAIHELGSKPHIIAAKKAPALVFFWPKVGHWVAFKSVHHPGTKGYHYLENALEAALRIWERGG